VNGSEARARWGLAIELAFLFSTGCAARSGLGAAGGFFRGPCGSEGFTPSASEHVIVELDKPLRVRTVEGIVTSQAGDWPEGVSVLFEIRPMAEAPSRPRGVRTDRRGHFEIPGVPAGEYCFKATTEGWQSVTGVIVVSPTADPDSRVNVEMPLGV
jgi:carboxypeptidase family protein